MSVIAAFEAECVAVFVAAVVQVHTIVVGH